VLRQVLQTAKRKARAEAPAGPKRRPADELAPYLAVPLHNTNTLREPDHFQARSYNLSRQVLTLIDYLFVRYPVPVFLYRSMLSYAGLQLVFEEAAGKTKGLPPESRYRDWFLAVARGESFAKMVKGVLTKREAHWFLQAPGGNSIEENLFWAKAAAAGVPLDGCDYLVGRFRPGNLAQIGSRLPDMLRFYADAWPEMRGHDKDEITDFVRTIVLDREFSFKGRTFGSMRKLCHEWHRTVYAAKVREYQSWSPIFPLWEDQSPARRLRAIELTSNRALADEGQKQRHCVFTYTDMCLQGRCSIVSLRWYEDLEDDRAPRELSRITVEVSTHARAIVQIRGNMNRPATEEEMKGIRLWAGAQGLRISGY
jgi:hypothetical protein